MCVRYRGGAEKREREEVWNGKKKGTTSAFNERPCLVSFVSCVFVCSCSVFVHGCLYNKAAPQKEPRGKKAQIISTLGYTVD